MDRPGGTENGGASCGSTQHGDTEGSAECQLSMGRKMQGTRAAVGAAGTGSAAEESWRGWNGPVTLKSVQLSCPACVRPKPFLLGQSNTPRDVARDLREPRHWLSK